jgi:hypothetical protein
MPCGDCVFFQELGLDLNNETYGECRRMPPPPATPGTWDASRRPMWARLVASEWCGEYRSGPALALQHRPKAAPAPAPPEYRPTIPPPATPKHPNTPREPEAEPAARREREMALPRKR